MGFLTGIKYLCIKCGQEKRKDTKCGFICERCGGSIKADFSPGVITFKPMWYRDICETPLYIESKRQLKEECKKHNVIACRLM